MFSNSRQNNIPPASKNGWHRLFLLVVLSLSASLVLGCNPGSSGQNYENPESGISLEKPETWELTYSERNGMIVLETENGIVKKDSARIEIQGPACLTNPTSFNDPNEEIEWNIDRIRMLYDLDSVTIIQEPTKVENGDYEVTKATIAIPTMSMLDDSARNQVGDRGPEISQTVDLYAITNRDHTVMAYLYRGNSEALNAQAHEIIFSIQITCSTKT